MKRFAVLLLAGCASTSGQLSTIESAQLDCDDYGFKRGTQGYAECVQREIQDRNNVAQRVLNPAPFTPPHPYQAPVYQVPRNR